MNAIAKRLRELADEAEAKSWTGIGLAMTRNGERCFVVKDEPQAEMALGALAQCLTQSIKCNWPLSFEEKAA